jgi:hypothetical protein
MRPRGQPAGSSSNSRSRHNKRGPFVSVKRVAARLAANGALPVEKTARFWRLSSEEGTSVRVSGGPPLCGPAFPQLVSDRQRRSKVA